MAEMWAAPTALRRALAEAFCESAGEVFVAPANAGQAERFVDGGGRSATRPHFTSAPCN